MMEGLREKVTPFVAEFVGTFMFLSVIGWAVINGGSGAASLAGFAIGSALMVCVYITGGHSGGHLNPAVSLAVFLSGSTLHKTRHHIKFGILDMLVYWLAQFSAAFLSGAVCYWMYGNDRPAHTTVSCTMSNGTVGNYTSYYGQVGCPTRMYGGSDSSSFDDDCNVSWGTGFLNEMMGTMCLCLVVLNVATSRPAEEGGGGSANAGNSTFGLAIGGSITAWAISAGSISGGAYNPAVGTLPIVWGIYRDVAMYYCGQACGAVFAFVLFYITNPAEFISTDTPIARACAIVKDELNEFVGTGLFCMVIALVAGNDNGGTTGLCIGTMLMVVVYMGGHISGGHYNPAVTLAITLRGKHPLVKLLTYWIAQSCGSLVGGAIAQAIADAKGPIQYGYPKFGTTSGYYNTDFTIGSSTYFGWGQAFGAETLGTFILCSAVLQCATCEKKNTNNSFYGLAIGFAVVVSAYGFGPVSGGAFNPAVGLLPVLKASAFECSQWVSCYWTGPFFGAMLAALFFWICNPDESYDHSIMQGKVFLYAEKGGEVELYPVEESEKAGDTTGAVDMEVETDADTATMGTVEVEATEQGAV
jgi:aquaporin Z